MIEWFDQEVTRASCESAFAGIGGAAVTTEARAQAAWSGGSPVFQSDVDASIKHVGLLSTHVFLGVIPMFHSFGIMAMMLAPMQLGSKVVYLARFSAVGVLNAIRQHNVSIMMGVPSMYGAMLRLSRR